MAYFSSFLICHLYFRHRFASTGYPILDKLWRATVYFALLLWTALVAYSRFVSCFYFCIIPHAQQIPPELSQSSSNILGFGHWQSGGSGCVFCHWATPNLVPEFDIRPGEEAVSESPYCNLASDTRRVGDLA